MKRLKIHNSAGDTIVEVMIVLAVLGLAFAISYATASHGLIQSRNAEEHSEALGIINSQVELVRSAVAQQTDPAITSSFCIPDPTKPTNIHPFASSPLSYTVPPSATADSASGYLHYGSSAPAGCISNIFYHESITYKPNIIDPAQSYLDFLVRWDGLGNLGPQQEELTYKVSLLSLTGTAWTNPVGLITPVLSVSGDTGPGGDFYSTDPVTFSVGGTNAGDTCVIKDDANPLFQKLTCSGFFSASQLPSNQTSNLTAYVTDSGTVYPSVAVPVTTINAPPPPVPVLSVSGGTGPGGDFYPGDTVTIKVTGIKSGDQCAIKDNAFSPKTYRTVTASPAGVCSGSFSSDYLPPDKISKLTASVTDSAKVYTSNTVSVTTMTPSCPYGYKQGTAAEYNAYGQPPPYCIPISL